MLHLNSGQGTGAALQIELQKDACSSGFKPIAGDSSTCRFQCVGLREGKDPMVLSPGTPALLARSALALTIQALTWTAGTAIILQ